MRYDISKPTAPKMPALGKGTECIKILLSQVSKDNYEPFVPMFFPVLGAQQVSKDNYEPFVPMFFPVLGAQESAGQAPDTLYKL